MAIFGGGVMRVASCSFSTMALKAANRERRSCPLHISLMTHLLMGIISFSYIPPYPSSEEESGEEYGCSGLVNLLGSGGMSEGP